MKSQSLRSAAAVIVFSVTTAYALEPPQKRTDPTDEQFAVKAARFHSMQVAMGESVSPRLKSPDIKEMSRLSTQTHSQAFMRLFTDSMKKRYPVPAKLGADDRARVDELMTLTGQQLEQTFLKRFIADHRDAIEMFEHEAKHGQDPDLQAYATDLLPALRKLRQRAESLNDTFGTIRP